MSNDSPLVCICIPTYNAASTVRETLDSILAQTYSNIVVHVSDNASTDDTLKVVDSIKDCRLIIHHHLANVGGEGNFNRCIDYAEGKYMAIFHADDLYEPAMVASQVAFLEANSDAGAVFTEASLIDDNANQIGSLRLPKNLKSVNSLYSFATIFKSILQYSNFLICPSMMARTDVYKKDIKSWRGEAFGTSADLDVWLRVLQYHMIGIIPKPLMRYRISLGQHSEKLRSRVTRSDFFRVIDHYLTQQNVQAILSSKDLLNYHRLERTDRVVRAANLYLLGNEQESKALCFDVLSIDAVLAAISSRRGFVTLSVGIFLHIFIVLNFPTIGKFFLLRLKRLARK